MTFTEIPVIDLSLSRSSDSRPKFLDDLRNALLNVGFMYIVNTGIDQELYDRVCAEGIAFFDMPEDAKLRLEMKNQPSFLGYSRLGNETTAMKADWREQYDVSTNHSLPEPHRPLYYNLRAPNQWPEQSILPTFRSTFEEYMKQMTEISTLFMSLIAEALGLPSTTFDPFFDADQQHKLKVIKYPDAGDGVGQGVGPHKDSMLTSYLLQASHHRGLQALNSEGQWVDCPPIRGSLVVALGQSLEALTSGVCTSTTHRVLSPAAGTGPRFSVPFFQGVSYDAPFEAIDIPSSIKAMKRDSDRKHDNVEFTFVKGRWASLGEAMLMNRVKSHPDVAEKWYPELLAAIRRDQQAQVSTGTSADLETGQMRE